MKFVLKMKKKSRYSYERFISDIALYKLKYMMHLEKLINEILLQLKEESKNIKN